MFQSFIFVQCLNFQVRNFRSKAKSFEYAPLLKISNAKIKYANMKPKVVQKNNANNATLTKTIKSEKKTCQNRPSYQCLTSVL